MRIPNDTSIDEIDAFLHRIIRRLNNVNTKDFILTDDEKHYAHYLNDISLYGFKPFTNNSIASLFDVLTMIPKWQMMKSYHYPIHYMMNSLQWLFNEQKFLYGRQISAANDRQLISIQNMIKRISMIIKDLSRLFAITSSTMSSESLGEEKTKLEKQFHRIEEDYKRLQLYLRIILIQIRRNLSDISRILLIVLYHQFPLLSELSMNSFYQQVQQWSNRVELIETLRKDQIDYSHIDELNLDIQSDSTMKEIDQALHERFSEDDQDILLFYSSDQLRSRYPHEWKEYYQTLILKRTQLSGAMKLIYIDFTSCQYHLEIFIFACLSKKELPKPAEINVLLFGETGVGKSTFINALVNYLAFHTLEQAETMRPIVLIPASFLTTVGDKFDEVRVHIGDPDPNEDYSRLGASVTQHCMSYIIPLRDDLQLRLIDTPGMGDTRGVDQDIINIDHILNYLNSLSQIHAICFLLKPNVTRLTVFFRSCLQQLLTYLTPNAYENIIFCFTSARTTFYVPGDTSPSLRKLLEQQKQQNSTNIPFSRANTFCFDSESFRYLAAIQQGLEFELN